MSLKFFNKDKALNVENIKKELGSIFNFAQIDLVQVTISDNHVTIGMPFVVNSVWSTVAKKLNDTFGQQIAFNLDYNIPIFEVKKPIIPNIKNIIAVSSGKGGVGKSASALNLALALKQEGARVGILDADIYGPSIPIMLGTQNESPQSPDNKLMYPIKAHGLVSISIGYLVKNEHASIWRGPMASKALNQLLTETQWPLLDYLIVDMPPGTGDIQLTMCQQLPLTAAVVVTTPQDIALSDAGKGIAMFDKLDIPVLGLIENMSYFECEKCHNRSEVFSSKGAQKLSQKYSLDILAEVPLNPIIREYADSGRSLLDEHPLDQISVIYKQAAMDLSKNLCELTQVMQAATNIANSIEITRLD